MRHLRARLRRGPAVVGAIAAALCVLTAPTAAARTEAVRQIGDLTAYCSTVNTAELPREALSDYGIEPDVARGLLTCQVRPRDPAGEPATVAAGVTAEVHGIGEPPRAVTMRETESDGFTSYIGTYPVHSRYPLQFTVTIDVPERAPVSLELEDHDPRP